MKNHIDSNFAISILVLVAACVGFAFWLNASQDDFSLSNDSVVQIKKDITDRGDASAPEKVDVPQGSGDPSSAMKKKLIVEDLGIEILYPGEYNGSTNTEKNRRGSSLSYDFRPISYDRHKATLNEIQFFPEDSIKQFTSDCGVELPCFFGDFPDLDRYHGQQKAFLNKKDYFEEDNEGNLQTFSIQELNGRYFFVNYIGHLNEKSIEYTTYIGDKKIDIWIDVPSHDRRDLGDELMEQISFSKL